MEATANAASKFIKENTVVTMIPTVVPAEMTSYTKNKPVKIPIFYGNISKSPYLKFPIWKETWDRMIGSYPELNRVTVLMEKLDKEAKKKIGGLKNNNVRAVAELERYYGIKGKIIDACMKEIHELPTINNGDFRGKQDIVFV